MCSGPFAFLFFALTGIPTDPISDAACLASAANTILNFVSDHDPDGENDQLIIRVAGLL